MKGDIKFIVGILFATFLIVAGGIYFATKPAKVYSKNELLLTNSHVLGANDAKVILVEFSDFQCPACKLYKPAVDEIVQKYQDKVLFGYRHFPLPQHEYGESEAIAAVAAEEQGKFWEMYTYLFAHQETITKDTPTEGAKEIGLDMTKFERDIVSDAIKERVYKDKLDGNRLGVNSTPTFFLNGKRLQLRGPSDLIKAVEGELQNSL